MADGAPAKRATADLVRKPRTIVLCFDGTSNEYNLNRNTNVVKFYSLLQKDKMHEQICYYQPGIGTYFRPGAVSPALRWGAKILDMGIAWYLSQHVLDGYKFLMQNYEAGDQVCLIGFSRGAYTARALAGFLHKIGLLLKDNNAQLSFAYKLYTAEDDASVATAAGFKCTFCQDVPIQFIGVWDTVASVGILTRKTLPFVTTNTAIRTFRHALALDERRAKFRASYYHHPAPSRSGDVQSPHAQPTVSFLKRCCKRLFWKDHGEARERRHSPIRSQPAEQLGTIDAVSAEAFKTDVKEVWFVGGHGDVGGGAAPDTEVHALADIPLCWMVHEAMRAQCGILFDSAALARLGIPPLDIFHAPATSGARAPHQQSTLNAYVSVHRRVEQERPLLDAQSRAASASADESDDHTMGDARLVEAAKQRINDQLARRWAWWLLEIVPTKFLWQSSTDEWVGEWSVHLGEGRGVPDREPPLFHESVRVRMRDPELEYEPRARYKKGTEVFVE